MEQIPGGVRLLTPLLHLNNFYACWRATGPADNVGGDSGKQVILLAVQPVPPRPHQASVTQTVASVRGSILGPRFA